MQSNEKQAAMNFFQRILSRLGWITEVADRLAADTRARLKILAVGLWFLLTDDFKPRTVFDVRLRQFGQEFTLQIGDLEHYSLLYEIFVKDFYALDPIDEPEVIFDLGSNIGASLIYFRLRYPQARLYGFEPDPRNFEYLKHNAASLEGVEINKVAVWSSDGEIEFYTDPHRRLASSAYQIRRRQGKQKVEARTLDGLMEERGIEQIDLLKFNIEGAEKEVFSAFQNINRVKYLIGEVHEDIGGCQVDELMDVLKDHTVRREKRGPERYMVRAAVKEEAGADE